jgi:hypothetical protein
MSRLTRILTVSAALAAVGAGVGAVIGMIAMGAFLLAHAPADAHVSAGDAARVFSGAALVGAAIGALLAPTVGWACLRHVPLGRAIAGTTLGAIAGALVAGLVAPPAVILLSVAGLLAAAVYLRLRTPNPRRLTAGADDDALNVD